MASSVKARETTVQTRTGLLDLPDEALMNILQRMCVPAPEGIRGVKNGRTLFAVATTCTRLYGLVCMLLGLDTIDALSPNYYEQILPLRHCHYEVSPAQVRAATCLAGHHLRVLRLPEGCPCPQLVLDGLTQRCPRLTELAFPDSGCLGAEVETLLFAKMSFLTRVYIFDPRNVLRRLAACNHLRELALTGVRPQSVDMLIKLLKTSGRWLYLLRIGFDANRVWLEDALHDPPEDVVFEQPSLWCVTRLASYLCERLQRDLPSLISLDVACSPMSAMTHEPLHDSSNLVEKIINLASNVSASRDRNDALRIPPPLRSIAIRTTNGDAVPLTTPFSPLITRRVDVEVQFPGTAVIFPSRGGVEALYFKSMQISTSFLENYPSVWSDELRKLEIIDIGTRGMVERYYMDATFRHKVGRLLKEAGTYLRSLQVSFAPKSIAETWEICRYVADVLLAAPSVTTLQIPSAVIRNDAEDNPEYSRMMTSLKHVHLLRLKTHEQGLDRRLFNFMTALPTFLDRVSISCPELQTLLLEKCPYFSCYSRHRRWLRESIVRVVAAAINRFQSQHPYADIESLRALLLLQ